MPFPYRKLRAKRESLGLSRADVGERSGLSPRSLERLEQGGITDPPLSTLQALCKALEVKCEFFFGDDLPEGEPVGPGRPRKETVEEPAAPAKGKRKSAG